MDKNSLMKKRKIEDIIRSLCLTIKCNMEVNTVWTEYSLRKELVACILGSQVRYEMAASALNRIEQAGLLKDQWWRKTDKIFESELYKVLLNEASLNEGNGSYRFSKLRAHQLFVTRNSIVEKSLYEMLFNEDDPRLKRKLFIDKVTGFGPKQASMFIRNTGASYDLAVLDTHVLNFMIMQNILHEKQINISKLLVYERIESIIKDYSRLIGYPIGYLDWAIWATMKAAKGMNA